jgi:hypothetical protein
MYIISFLHTVAFFYSLITAFAISYISLIEITDSMFDIDIQWDRIYKIICIIDLIISVIYFI